MKHAVAMIASVLLIVGIAIAFRVPRLGVRPMHADEAVQAARFRDLWQHGEYVYDPNEFHGPTLIYATLPSVWLDGADRFAATTKVTYRIVPVVFGCLLVLLVFTFAGAIGKSAAVWAALFAAVSPAMVFYSRYYIHETLLAFLTLAALACAWRYVQKPRLMWAIAFGACAGLMQATKETAAIAYLGGGIALVAAALLASWTARHSAAGRPAPDAKPTMAFWKQVRWWHLATALVMFVLVSSVFLSSFLSNWRGPIDGVATYLPWLRRAGGQSPHVHPWHFYLHRLFWWRLQGGRPWSEWLIGVLAVVGLVSSMLRKSSGMGQPLFSRWLAFYTLTMTGLYCLIPYKTPWCLMQFWIGWLLLAGVGAAAIVRVRQPVAVRLIVTAFLLLGVGDLAWQAYQGSWCVPADVRNPYVYAQTSFGVEKLATQLEQLALASPDHHRTQLKLIWPDPYYWPLPWYLRAFDNTQFWREMPPDPRAPIIIASPQFDAQLTARLGGDYLMTDYYQLRPHVLVQLWVQFDLWEAHLKRLGRI